MGGSGVIRYNGRESGISRERGKRGFYGDEEEAEEEGLEGVDIGLHLEVIVRLLYQKTCYKRP